MGTAASGSREVARAYTRMLRIPIVIGKLTGGWRLPGGPFTLIQLLAAAVAVLLGRWVMGLAGISSPIAVVFGLAAAAFGAAVGVGYLPRSSRNLFTLGLDAARAVVSPASGLVAGKRPRSAAAWTGRNRGADIAAARRLHGLHPAMAAPSSPHPAPPQVAATAPPLPSTAEPAPDPAPVRPRELVVFTGVERLRALATAKKGPES